ncbi:MAG: hypothetical protein R3B13_07495 [Polyangiaceae bacterium]
MRSWYLLLMIATGCGGNVGGDGSSGGNAGAGGADAAVGGVGGGGTGGLGGSGGGTGGVDAGWTECGTPDFAACDVPECPEGRPGCSFCVSSKQDGVYGICAENLDPNNAPYKPTDGTLLLAVDRPMTPSSALIEVHFSAGVFLTNHGQGDRVAYADRGKWTGEPLPAPTECPQPAGARHCGGQCGGCPVGEVCTGRSPLHPYGACIPKTANICSRNPEVKDGGACSPGDRCFIFTVEAENQPIADATGFCVKQALCEAYAAHLPGGVQCK